MAIRGKQRVPQTFPAPPTPGIYRKIAYSFVALTIIIVFAALWFSSVRATVRVVVARESTPVTVQVDVARSPETGQLAGRVVQGVFELIKEYEITEGEGNKVAGISTGRVSIINDFSRDQALVKTTRLLNSDGRLYRIDETVNVPAGGSVEVNAYSDEEGAKYDFSETTKFTIPGLSESLQTYVYAESVSAFQGGERMVRVLRQEDIDKATKDIEEAVLEQAKTTLKAEVADTRFSEAVFLMKVIEKKSSEQLGDEADHFLLSLKLDVTGVFYNKADMDGLVRERVKDRVPEGREIAAQDPIRTDFSVESVAVGNETATVIARAEVLTKLTDPSGVISKEAILGLPIEEAEKVLEALPEVEDAEIRVRPEWVRRLPTLKDHVTIKME